MTWPMVPLKSVATELRETIEPAAMGAADVYYYSIPAFDETGKGQYESPSAIGSAKSLLSGSELLISKLNPRISRVLLAEAHEVPTVASTEFIALRLKPSLHRRFARYWLQSDRVRQHLDSATLSVTRSQQRVRPDTLMASHIPLPSLDEQHAIADYLDREIARIDALIGAKTKMVRLIGENWAATLDGVIWSGEPPTTRVMHLADPARPVMYGIVLPGPDVGGDGVAIVKGGDVARSRLAWDKLCKTTVDIERQFARARLKGGDLVYAIRGGIGDVAVVPAGITGANITQDVARIAPRLGVDGVWLMYALQSPRAQSDARSRVTGATITGLNIWELDRIRVPIKDARVQDADRTELDAVKRRTDAMMSATIAQIHLLNERRRALITATVTGGIAVPVAA